MANPSVPPLGDDYKAGVVGVPDRTPNSWLSPAPPQLDYRTNPNLGQQAGEEHGQFSRDAPHDAGQTTAPQPQIGHRGYSINQLDAPPNQLIPNPQTDILSPGQTPDNQTSLGAWDFWTAP